MLMGFHSGVKISRPDFNNAINLEKYDDPIKNLWQHIEGEKLVDILLNINFNNNYLRYFEEINIEDVKAYYRYIYKRYFHE